MPARGLGMAHVPAPSLAFGRYKSGNYYWTCLSGTTSAQTLAAGFAFAGAWLVPDGGVSVAKIGAEVSGAGGASSVVRIGVWADDGSGAPGTLLLDAGTINGTSATVQDITLGQALVLPAGLYWAGTASQVGTAPTIRTAATPYIPTTMSAGTAIPSANTSVGAYTQSSVTGAFGASFTASPGVAPATQVPRIHFKTS